MASLVRRWTLDRLEGYRNDSAAILITGLRIVRRPQRWVWSPKDVEPSPLPAGFRVQPHRWIAERTLAWLGRYRRMSKDYEFLPESVVACIESAMIRLMLRRLAPMVGRTTD